MSGKKQGTPTKSPKKDKQTSQALVPMNNTTVAAPSQQNLNNVFTALQHLNLNQDSKVNLTVDRGGRISAVVTAEEVVEKKVTLRPNFDVVCVLDVSGSMSGSHSRETYRCFKYLYDNVLQESDGIALVLFSSSSRTVINLKNKRNVGDLTAELNKANAISGESFVCGGGTALWDAIKDGMRLLAHRPRGQPQVEGYSHPHLVVLTDGGDCSSTRVTCEAATVALREPGTFADEVGKKKSIFSQFHCSIITVGSDSDRHVQKMREMVSGKPNLHHYNASSSSEIEKCFRSVSKTIKTTQQTTTTITTSTRTLTSEKQSKSGKR